MLTPRVAAIHDMSGFGRCSLTVAIPILSAMGLQCCPLPTAFLSTHTGGFEGFTFLDMTDEMPKVALEKIDQRGADVERVQDRREEFCAHCLPPSL